MCYDLDESLVDRRLGRAGFFVLLSSQEALSSVEVLGCIGSVML